MTDWVRKEKNKETDEVLAILSDNSIDVWSMNPAGWLMKNGERIWQFKGLCMHLDATVQGCEDCGAYGCQIN